jgi:Ig-like domain CHU_C associated
MGKRLLIISALVLFAANAVAVTTKDMSGGLTADEIVKTLTGAGVTISNIKVTGSPKAIGTFTGGNADGLDIDEGVIMSTGLVSTAAGPNTSESTSFSFNLPGDAGLDALIAPNKTHDAIILEFDAVTSSPTFSIRYIFASEEYKEFVGSAFNDVFAFFVDGTNIALVPGSSDPVAVNTINFKKNAGLYKDNPANSGNFGTSFDGFTVQLTAVATVSAGTPHHIRLAIADATDTVLDSAVFLAKGGIAGTGVTTAVIPDLSAFGASDGVVLATNLDENNIPVTIFGVPNGATPDVSATGLPDDSTVTFTPTTPLGLGALTYNMHVKIGPDTPAGTYPLVIRAGIGDFETFATVIIVVDCDPPFILGSPGHQPASTTVNSGQTATLTVSPTGAPPFRYQWYVGHSGSTAFPITGGNTATLTTPPITTGTEFWVRVSNPCGSRDSQTAVVTPR